MSDRELLEMAATAAGYDFHWRGLNGVLPSIGTGADQKWWNPLTDDGDALRLAVALGIEIIPDRQIATVITAFCVHRPNLIGLNTIEEFSGDEMAATRRAIVRAAAEIGPHRKQHNHGGNDE